jgi:hypothetical protein
MMCHPPMAAAILRIQTCENKFGKQGRRGKSEQKRANEMVFCRACLGQFIHSEERSLGRGAKRAAPE